MAVKRLIKQEVILSSLKKQKLQARFMAEYAKANTVAELRKCVRILSQHVFDESNGEL